MGTAFVILGLAGIIWFGSLACGLLVGKMLRWCTRNDYRDQPPMPSGSLRDRERA